MGRLEQRETCLDDADLAAWVDGSLDSEARADAVSHLVGCPSCRRAVASLVETLRSDRVSAALQDIEGGSVGARGPERRRGLARTYRVGAAAAIIAAVLAGVLFLRPTDLDIEGTLHREAPTGTASMPQVIAPVGELEAVDAFTWSPVSGADLYRVTVFDEEGTVVWEAETEESRLVPPANVEFETGMRYFWKVTARVGWDRWVDSELVNFTTSQP